MDGYTYLILGLFAVVALAEPIDVLAKNSTEVHALCSPCKEVFEKLNLSLGGGNKTALPKEKLRLKAKELCHTLITKPYELKCQKVVAQNVDNVYSFIQKHNKKIQPLSICKYIGIC